MTFGGEFWTLTYADAPEKGGYADFQKFLKRLRSMQRRSGNELPIRYLGCGEYGAKSGRFHYHALIFNVPSRTPEAWHTRLWPLGFVYIGDVTAKSIRYTARYTLKFHAKGREAVAGWSRSPPLGDAGMRAIARYMADRGDVVKKPPTGMRIGGVWYPLDQAMRLAFWSEWTAKPVKYLRDQRILSSAAGAHLNYLVEKKLGDPVEQQRKRDEDRSTFWETARMTYEKI